MGETTERAYCPAWYPNLRAARYLGVAPWELEQMPVVWRYRALAAQDAENMAENERMKQATKR